MPERAKRRLAAIVAADVAGFSRLVGIDEEGTLQALRGHRSELVEPLLAEHGGRVANTAGDSLLLEFPSAVDAVRCAAAMQQGMTRRNAALPADRRILFRVGVHVGDVVAEGTDVLGDGVNVAARIQAESEPGGIVVSDDAYRQIRDRLPYRWRDGGELALKNIVHPVRVWFWSDASESNPTPTAAGRASLPLPERPSIAALAFQNMSGDPEQEFFSDGITEDIITNLSKNRGFFVIARNSSFTYKGQAVDVTRVARELGVRYVLEGSVRKAGNRVRITAQLIDAPSGRHIWAERYDRELTDVFTVQDEITRAIVGIVAPSMLEAEMERARRKDPLSLDAWEYAIRAQWHLARLTREDNKEALRLATQSTELNSTATAGLNIAAFAHIYDAVYSWSDAPAVSIGAAYEAGRRAVALDPRDEVSQAALGTAEIFMGRHDDAIARLRLAVELNPNFTWAHGDLGLALALAGCPEEAIGSLHQAVRLSPRDQFNFLWHFLLGFAMYLMQRHDEALAYLQQSLRENPEVPGPYRLRAACLSDLGRLDEAHAALAEFIRYVPNASIGAMKTQLPLRRPEDFERYAASLRRIGMPE